MRRPTSLEIDTVVSHELAYELETSPPASLYTIDDLKHSSSKYSLPQEDESSPPPTPATLPSSFTPSIRLLFSLISFRQRLFLLTPAIIFSAIAGGIAPFMTYVIGQVFDAFAHFPLSSNPPQSAKDQLLHDVGIAAIELVGLAIGSIALSSLTSSLWIWTGEHNAMALRKRVYEAVTQKDMTWFDTQLSEDKTVDASGNDQSPVGAGGLMAKFTRETDEVRMASSLSSGMLIQYLTTCITCLVLAFIRSWALTLVILSAVPALVLIQIFSQAVAGPLLAAERSQTAIAGTLIDRAVNAIATVKAFNASRYEESAFDTVLNKLKVADKKLNAVWGFTSSLSQFVMMAMFVQGFWFGAKLIRDGKVAPGDVMAVFWACLIATSNLQMCIPQFITVAKGKFAMVSLLTLAESTPSPSTAPSSRSSTHRASHIRGIRPRRCEGELALHDLTFAYPSRPTVPVLEEVSLYLPARETTFIVGGSGSGKSTIAQLLLRMYAPQSGSIQLDDQDISYLDEQWTREHVAAVSQGCILFDMTVHENVAMGLVGASGRTPADATRAEVVAACTAALMHEFIRDLPDGYDTKLGTGGANLSGGQKQRLAIARAQLRNPSVLILDEATSALDPTSRILVFEAIKRWRKDKTTIVITHDLSQISGTDFVYVLKDGHVAEQGYRNDLETTKGEFSQMMHSQGSTGDCLPTKDISEQPELDRVEELLDETLREVSGDNKARPFTFAQDSVLRPKSHAVSNWMFDVVAELTTENRPKPAMVNVTNPTRISRYVPQEHVTELAEYKRLRRPSSAYGHLARPLSQLSTAPTTQSRPYSLQFTPTSPVFPMHEISLANRSPYDPEKAAFNRNAPRATPRRTTTRNRWDPAALTEIKVEKDSEKTLTSQELSFWGLIREIYPTVPYKPLICFGLLICVLSGVMTPLFSFLLSRLLFEVSIGAENTHIINIFGGLVLAIAALDGILLGSKYFLMETFAMNWISRIRTSCFKLILAQDKRWFDKSENSPVRLVQVLLKDGDDARNLISVVLAQFLVVGSMLSVGLIWALVRGWQLTLVGFAIAPVFAATMAIQSKLIAKCEVRNKRAREEVAKMYYDTISNIRGIRSMMLDPIFQDQFDISAEKALSTGVKGAFIEGCTYGIASGLIYLAEALLFYVGAVLISRGTYTYLQMVQVLNLVVFTVTIGSQLMAFTEKIAKSVQATRDFNELLRLTTETQEAKGFNTPPIEGPIVFKNVDFSYPERPDVPILKGLDLEISQGECVAIVGSSGSGKSTVAALLQRLYEPDQGAIHLGLNDLQSTSVEHLRRNVSVVSQNPHLFNATISENIIYGDPTISEVDVRKAAKAAYAHEFIMSLPQGYDTMVGENASLISGGQAQRLAIARALARPSNIMILDECTSALDSSNQAAVLDSICNSKYDRTIIMVTHKLPVMQLCDRIIVVGEGKILEEGSYHQLMERKGVFAMLASGGEWSGE
ncbi:P-loop containing nucleoside triphosphate hydrolase protein [Mycena floridula]|nr:P-loop containing nucleoside triphosphate hydrolase protein [Mycena floridula]